jgi:methionyl-tRNA formyltransferase
MKPETRCETALNSPHTKMQIVIAGADGADLTDAVRDLLPDARLVTRALRTDDVAATDLLISAAHEHFIPAAIRGTLRLGAVGLHPSLLPRYRGSYPLWWALRNREHEVGLTLFHLVDRIDAGPVIDQHRVAVLPRDTFATLYGRVTAEVPGILTDLLHYITAHDKLPKGVPQDDRAATTVRTPSILLRALMKARWAIR